MLAYVIDHLDHDFSLIQSFHPENLHFILNDEDVSTIEFEITKSSLNTDDDPVISGNDFMVPKSHHFRLRYGASVNIMAGPITSVKMAYGQNYMQVSGGDWLWYFAQRFMPFDGRENHSFDYTLQSPNQAGINYETSNTDVADILTAILDMVLGRPNSLPITYSLDPTGLLVDHFRLDLADTTSLLDIVKQACSYVPGIAFEITPGRVFQISQPDFGSRWYGEPEDIAADPFSGNLIWTVDDDHPPLTFDYTNLGPRETHIQGEGSGTTNRNVVTLGNEANQEVYWRLDRAEQFNDAVTRDTVEARTHEQFAFDLNPQHEMPLALDPDIVDKMLAEALSEAPGDEDGFFWTTFKPGRAMWIDLQLVAHHVDSAHHIVSMDATVQANGSTTVQFAENQIYDTTGQAHVDEG